PTSVSEPQAWHSGQRPIQRVAANPHSLQRWAGRDFTTAGGTWSWCRRGTTERGRDRGARLLLALVEVEALAAGQVEGGRADQDRHGDLAGVAEGEGDVE